MNAIYEVRRVLVKTKNCKFVCSFEECAPLSILVFFGWELYAVNITPPRRVCSTEKDIFVLDLLARIHDTVVIYFAVPFV